jgi:hypothetical protein
VPLLLSAAVAAPSPGATTVTVDESLVAAPVKAAKVAILSIQASAQYSVLHASLQGMAAEAPWKARQPRSRSSELTLAGRGDWQMVMLKLRLDPRPMAANPQA